MTKPMSYKKRRDLMDRTITIIDKSVVLEPRFIYDYDACYCDRVDYDHERIIVMRKDSENFTTKDYNYLESLGLELTSEWGASSYYECDEKVLEIESQTAELYREAETRRY